MNTRLQGRNTSRRYSLSALAPLLVAALANAQVTTRVSVDSLGGEADQHSDYPALSRNGRLVVFESQARTWSRATSRQRRTSSSTTG
jgi:hypothetical protein